MSAYPDIVPGENAQAISIWDVTALTKALRMSKFSEKLALIATLLQAMMLSGQLRNFLARPKRLKRNLACRSLSSKAG